MIIIRKRIKIVSNINSQVRLWIYLKSLKNAMCETLKECIRIRDLRAELNKKDDEKVPSRLE